MRISAIAAMSENYVIGKDNKMPWHLPADLKHFKAVTLGKPILMGRKTYESIGRPLPGRQNIVITRDPNYKAPGCVVVTSIEAGIKSVADADEIFIIGGAMLYEATLQKTQRIYLTIIHHSFEGDAFFPVLNQDDWIEIQRIDHAADTENPFAYSFLVMDRK